MRISVATARDNETFLKAISDLVSCTAMVDFGRPTTEMVRSLYKKQIYVRPGAFWGMPDFMRISVGTAHDNETFLTAIGELVS